MMRTLFTASFTVLLFAIYDIFGKNEFRYSLYVKYFFSYIVISIILDLFLKA